MTITRKQKWEEKQLHGRFKRLINNISHDKIWTWLRKGNFKRETESLLIAAQNNAIRTNHIKARIYKTQQNSKCRLCGDRKNDPSHNKRMQQIILERVDVSVVCERWVEKELLLPISSSRSQGVPTLAPPCKFVRDASGRLRVPRSTAILCTLSKSYHVVLITWSPSGYTPVRPEFPDRAVLFANQNVTACQAHGVPSNEPKFHGICYKIFLCMPFFKMSTYGHFLHVSLHLLSTPHTKQNF